MNGLLLMSIFRLRKQVPNKGINYVAPLDRAHDLLIYGNDRGDAWFAAVSLLELIKAIRALPDANVVDGPR